MRKPNIIWKPYPGAQKRFLTCPVWECLLHGNRGGGKTDVLIMDFLQGVGKGYDSDYKGLLLREATTELGDVITKTRKWIPRIFPSAKYNASRKIWTFEDGETLWLNYARTLEDYDQYHGHEYPWIGWEELTNHALDEVYLKLMSCNRSSNAKIPIKYRATCNPSGPGHSWVKARFIDAVPVGKVLKEELEVEYPDTDGTMITDTVTVSRTHVQSYQSENKSLTEADPLYIAKLYSVTKDNEMLRKAWIDGSWDLIIGGFFTDVWDPKIHIKQPFDIPKSWSLYRSFDWGSSKPWSVTYGFEANGEQPEFYDEEDTFYIPKGSIIIPTEIYGWTGKPNEGDQATSQEIAQRVISVDNALLTEYGIKCTPGPADTQIWEVRDGTSIAKNLRTHGCRWTRAYKGSGSRVAGWALIRQMLGAAKRGDLETPHLYFFPQAKHHIRTLVLMQRDKRKPEDIDCFVAGTLVDTKKGKIPIEDISIGDFVNTPIGFRKVIKSGISGVSKTFKIILSNGKSLQGTPDHKVFVENKGLVSLCKLKIGDELCQRYLHFTEESNSQVKTDHILNAIIQIVPFLMEQRYCTEQNSKIILEKFQKDLKFITKTTINLTTVLRILNLCMAQITQDITCKKDLKKVGIYTKNLKDGENLKKVKNNLEKILKSVVKILPKENVRAFIVVNLLLQNIQQKNSVQLNVETQFQEKSKKNVLFVENFSGQNHIKQEKHKLVVTNVDGNCGEQIVYNLTTEQAHLYYANDCLVSNTDLEDHCMDSGRYLLSRKMSKLSRKKVGV